MEIWACRIVNSDGTEDMEFLDSEPTESFRDGLWNGIQEGRIQFWSIRMGYLNGGDSRIEFCSHG